MESQLQWVLSNGPWSFKDHPLVLRRWKRGMTTATMVFTSIPLWVQVWGLPFDLFTEKVRRDIEKGIGTVVEVDNTAFKLKQARFIRIRVELPLDKPIRRSGFVVGFRRKEGGTDRRPNSPRRKEQPQCEGYQPKDWPQINQETIPEETRAISSFRGGEESEYSHVDFPEAQITETSNFDIMGSDYSVGLVIDKDPQKGTNHHTPISAKSTSNPSMKFDLMQSNVAEIGGKEVVETDMVSPLKATHINLEIVDVHGMSDMTYDKSGTIILFGLINVNTHAISSTKQPTWTRKTRH
nr:hypothetical protein CFP56_31288 [Quercus suber]